MKAVFTAKPQSSYDDAIEIRYHFPRTYLNQVKETVGDFIIYYEPRRTSTHFSSIGGRQSYFAVAYVDSLTVDSNKKDHYYAHLTSYMDFDNPVPFNMNGYYFESSLAKNDGTTNKGAFGRYIRLINDTEFNEIIRFGFCETLKEDNTALFEPINGLAEPAPLFERPLIDLTMRRRFRDRVFTRRVRSAYDLRCAVTGLRILNGGGRPEVQAAHIRPVSKDGPDSVRNGLALSGNIHWMFDRGLISITDDYKIITARNLIPSEFDRLINSNGSLYLPDDNSLRPHN